MPSTMLGRPPAPTRIVLVTRPTRLDELIERHGSLGAVEFQFRDGKEDEFASRVEEDERYKAAVARVKRELPFDMGMPAEITWDQARMFIFKPEDLIIAIGPDGLFVNVAKYTNRVLILTVNPDPKRIDGKLMLHAPDKVAEKIARIRAGEYDYQQVTMAEAATSDGRRALAVNDFHVGYRTRASTYYSLTFNGKTERQSSSGVVISTGTGMSGWMKSIYETAESMTGRRIPRTTRAQRERRDARELVFAVDAAFRTNWTSATKVHGIVHEGQSLEITSSMPEGGMIWSDGMWDDPLFFNEGVTATFGIAKERAYLVL